MRLVFPGDEKKRKIRIVGINMGLFVSGDRIQKFLADLKSINKHDLLDSSNP